MGALAIMIIVIDDSRFIASRENISGGPAFSRGRTIPLAPTLTLISLYLASLSSTIHYHHVGYSRPLIRVHNRPPN